MFGCSFFGQTRLVLSEFRFKRVQKRRKRKKGEKQRADVYKPLNDFRETNSLAWQARQMAVYVHTQVEPSRRRTSLDLTRKRKRTSLTRRTRHAMS